MYLNAQRHEGWAFWNLGSQSIGHQCNWNHHQKSLRAENHQCKTVPKMQVQRNTSSELLLQESPSKPDRKIRKQKKLSMKTAQFLPAFRRCSNFSFERWASQLCCQGKHRPEPSRQCATPELEANKQMFVTCRAPLVDAQICKRKKCHQTFMRATFPPTRVATCTFDEVADAKPPLRRSSIAYNWSVRKHGRVRLRPLRIPNRDKAKDASNGAHVNIRRGIGCLWITSSLVLFHL